MIEPVDRSGRMSMQPGTDDQEQDVERDIQEDAQELDPRETPGLAQIAQVGERHATEGVDRDNTRHHSHIFRMFGVTQTSADLGQEQEDQQDEKGRAGHQAIKDRRVDSHRFRLLLLVDESEEAGLHAVSQEDEQQRCPSI